MKEKGLFRRGGAFWLLLFFAILVFSLPHRSCELRRGVFERRTSIPPDIGACSIRIDRAIAREIKYLGGKELSWERRNKWAGGISWIYSHGEARLPEERIPDLTEGVRSAVRALGGDIKEKRILGRKLFSFYAFYKGLPVGYYVIIGTRNPKKGNGGGTVKLSIIIDDVGSGGRPVDELISIGLPLTLSIIPGTPRAAEIARRASAAGMEVMIHIPMEPYGWAGKRSRSTNALTVDMSDDEIRERVRGFIEGMPYAVGANNHMGSLFTEREDLMRPVLEELKANGLFFIDSRTSQKSIAYDLARRMGIRTGYNMVFLDSVPEKGRIERMIRLAVEMARKHGHGIAIGHHRPRTVSALKEMEGWLKGIGDVKLVHASEVVR